MDERKKERVAILLACSPKDAPETAVLIAICSMNIWLWSFPSSSCPTK